MKIGIIATHSWPVQTMPIAPYTGDYVYGLLAKTLDELGHTVSFFAPAGSYKPQHGHLYEMQCSYGKYPPSGQECEFKCWNDWQKELFSQDIVHDFSTWKTITNSLNHNKRPVIQSHFGGIVSYPPHNIVFQTASQAERASRGATDYENTPTPNLAGPNGPCVKGKFVFNGIDTDFYYPADKEDFYLWLGKWHPIRGYRDAIDFATKENIKLVLAGPQPTVDQLPFVKEINILIEHKSNITIKFLPEGETHNFVKRDLLQKAKVLLSPTQFNEPFGLTLTESLACGTPIIATNYGSMPEIIGHCAPPATSQECRDRAVKLFDRKIMAEAYLKLYKDIIAGETW